jgi:hypothetical protein
MESINERIRDIEENFSKNLTTFEEAAGRAERKVKECYWIMEKREPCYTVAES